MVATGKRSFRVVLIFAGRFRRGEELSLTVGLLTRVVRRGAHRSGRRNIALRGFSTDAAVAFFELSRRIANTYRPEPIR